MGGVSRISPEAPVPVVHVKTKEERAGGAANVALGVAALGGKVCLQGIIGTDPEGEILGSLLQKGGVRYRLSRFSNQSTVTKLRILGQNQQMMRLDRESAFTSEAAERLCSDYLEELETADAVILSDYDKGTLGDISFFIERAREKGVPVVVDPKKRSFSHYLGATVVTPNVKEFELAVGGWETDEEMIKKARLLLRRYNIAALVLTRSEKGLLVVPQKGEVTQIPAQVKEVHDVTGAGDTVTAVLGIALASGMTLEEAASLANTAAGIAVSKLGTSVVLREELVQAIHQINSFERGVLSEEILLSRVHASKACGERIVFTNGCFDLLHAGHVLYLQEARRLGDRLVVGVNNDDSVRRLKGSTRPINRVEDRMAVLAGLECVDWVVPFEEDTPERLIQAISPDVLVKGGDYTSVDELAGAQHVKAIGGEVRILGLKEGCSTTRMIKSILDAEKEDPGLQEAGQRSVLTACCKPCSCAEKKNAFGARSTSEA